MQMGNKQTKAKPSNQNSFNFVQQVSNQKNFQQFPSQQVPQPQQIFQQQIPTQYQQQQQQYLCQYQPHFKNLNTPHLTRLNIKPDDKQKQTVAVIVTFSQNGTYDQLFTQVQQKAQPNTKVLVYKASSYAFQNISKAIFNQQYQNDTYKELAQEISKVDKDCVVFNWQCCGFYTAEQFAQGQLQLYKFVKNLIDKGFMCMFSDFSLKALVKTWNQELLGQNPFVKIGQNSNTTELRFKAGQLKECPSAQLQTVGEMAEEGKVNVHCLGGTIVYSVNKDKLNHDKYKLKVLTVATNMSTPENYQCKIGQFSGAAGHVLVKYPSGGSILTSMTHWIELMKVDTSQQKLFEVAAREYGQQYAQQQRQMYDVLDQSSKKVWRSNKASEFIQNQAPCTNMRKKAR